VYRNGDARKIWIVARGRLMIEVEFSAPMSDGEASSAPTGSTRAANRQCGQPPARRARARTPGRLLGLQGAD
jgi:hypothetical protein